VSTWSDRPVEVANLLNPAFSAVVTHECVRNYEKAATVSMPFALAFLAVPIALHAPTRAKLPKSTLAKMRPWLEATPEARVGFTKRARTLQRFVREGVLFASHHGLIECSGSGDFTALRKTQLSLPESWRPGSDAYECLRAVGLVARWFATTAGTPTLFALWGVKP